MKKILQLCLLAILLVFSTSCVRMVHKNYEIMDNGTVTAIDTTKYSVTLYSSETNTLHSWNVSDPTWENLSTWRNQSSDKIAIGDHVFIYRDIDKMLISKHSVADAKNINKALSAYFWQNLLQNWYWLILIGLIVSIFALRKIKSEIGLFSSIILGWVATLGLLGANSTLHQQNSGTVTQINPETKLVVLDTNYTTAVTTLDDITTHKPITVGQHVTLYHYTNLSYGNSRKVFMSSKELNVQTLKASQPYPEIWLMGSIVFLITVLLVQGLIILITKICTWILKSKET